MNGEQEDPWDHFHQRRQHPFHKQRKSAPNIETFGAFSSPVLYRKRNSIHEDMKYMAELVRSDVEIK